MRRRLGEFIGEVRAVASFVWESRKLNGEEDKARARFQRMQRRFGGISGRAVTLESVTEYLAVDLEAAAASSKVIIFNHPEWDTGDPSVLVQTLKIAQDIYTPKGRTAAVKIFEESREAHISDLSWLRKMGLERDVAEQRRLVRACGTAIQVLSRN